MEERLDRGFEDADRKGSVWVGDIVTILARCFEEWDQSYYNTNLNFLPSLSFRRTSSSTSRLPAPFRIPSVQNKNDDVTFVDDIM